MRLLRKSRRTWAKNHIGSARIDRATGEVLEPEEPIAVFCEYCEGPVDDSDDDHFSGFPHEWGRSEDGVVYGAQWGDDTGCWPVRSDGLVLYGQSIVAFAAFRARRD